jgi:hypothetical protein
MSHTPGPWHVGQGNGEGHVFCAGGGRVTPGPVLWPVARFGFGQPDDEDNGRLIAAAPDLLAACRALLTHFPDLGEMLGEEDELGQRAAAVVEQVRAAVARAE